MVFQPAEETLVGALSVLESGLLADIDEMVGIHLRPIQEAKWDKLLLLFVMAQLM